jgi:hypothetical protein
MVPLSLLGQESRIAAQLGIDHVDYRRYLLDHLPAGGTFLGLSANKVFADLDGISNEAMGTDCVLLSNLDLALAGLVTSERMGLLRERLFNQFCYRRRGLLIAMPDTDSVPSPLFDHAMRQHWLSYDRLVVWGD